jgi:hypothetical protein
MLSDQQRARVFGVLYLITFVTSIPALLLYQPVLDDPVGYIAGGGPLIILSGTLVLFGVADAGGPLQGIATIPEGLWELLLGIYCAVKGFRPSAPILQAAAGGNRTEAMPAATPA